MNNTYLGKTGISVSRIGLGTVKFGRNQDVKYPKDFSLPTLKEIHNLLAITKELGINLIDTAPAYGESETILGNCLTNRNDWVICTKAGENYRDNKSTYDYRPAEIIKSVENSLTKLKTDYLDIVLIHSNGEDLQIIDEYQVFDTLSSLKQKGLIRSFGMSTKTLAGGLKTIENADCAMITYNPTYQDELKVIKRAEELNAGVLIKKCFASGHIDKISNTKPIETALKFIFEQKGVSSAILGTINIQHLKQNVNCINEIFELNYGN